MRTEVVLKLDMGGRALRFCLDHPIPGDRGHAMVVANLGARLAYAEEAAERQLHERKLAATMVDDKARARHDLHESLLVLGGIARAAATREKGVYGLTKVPPAWISELDLLSSVRARVSEAREVEALLVEYGLPAGLLDLLSADADRLAAAHSQKSESVTAHVAATAGLADVAADVMRLVTQLDASHRHYYAHDRESMSGWRSARNVRWPRSSQASAPGQNRLSTDYAD